MARETKPLYEFGPFHLNPAEGLLLRDGQPIALSPKAFEVLEMLVANHGHLLEKEEMMKRLWPESFVEEGNLAKYVFTVREALGDDRNGSKHIQTLPKRGYRFVAPVRVIEATSSTVFVPEGLPADTAPFLARAHGQWRLLLGVALFAFGVSTLAWFRWGTRTPPLQPKITRLTALAGEIGNPALSPDGNSFVFAWRDEKADNSELFLQRIGSGTPLRLTLNAGYEQWPTWSPDGNEIAFVRCTLSACGIYAIPSLGGVERKLTDLRHDRYHWLAWSPDGKTIAFAERNSDVENYGLFLLSVETLEKRRVSLAGDAGVLRFVFSPDSRTLAVISLAKGGSGVRLRSVDTAQETVLLAAQQEWFGSIAWNASGGYLVLSANQKGVRRLWKLPVEGGELEPLVFAGEDAYYPSVSPDGKRLAFIREYHDWDLWRVTLANGKPQSSRRFLSSPRSDVDPAFSPDGRRIAFASNRGGAGGLWISSSDGDNPTQLASVSGLTVTRPSWSPDGRFLAFGANGIRVVPADGGPIRILFSHGEMPSWSPDGRWIYFSHATNGAFRVWKIPAEGGEAVQVTADPAFGPQLDAQGSYLYYAKMNAPGIWRVGVAGGKEARVIADFNPQLSGYWEVCGDGIYYVAGETMADGTASHHVNFFHFASGRTSKVAPLSGALEPWGGGMSISPDRRTILYSQVAYQSSEIMLIENFH